MPLNVGRFYTSIFLVLSALTAIAEGQSPQASQSPSVPAPLIQPIDNAPTAAEVMRARISKAKAFIAVRNYNAAIYELEQIRRETSDPSVRSGTNVLLMNSYLEQGDYKRAQAMLTEHFNQQKTTLPNALENYSIIAGQIVKGARNQAERYRSLGLSVTDRNLPLEALTDLEKMRETVELVIAQAKEIGADKKKASTAIALIEEAANSRAIIARDEYDAKRWQDALADSREQMANSRSVIVNAVDGTTTSAAPPKESVAVTTTPAVTPAAPTAKSLESTSSAVLQPADPKNKPPVTQVPASQVPASPASKEAVSEKPKIAEPKPTAEAERKRIVVGGSEEKKEESDKQNGSAKNAGPLEVGSLIAYVTKQTSPVYPPTARSIRATGIVRVDVTIDEEGNVSEIQNASGPVLLQASAKDAIRKWKFRPFIVDGQPVKASGFINFNFSL